VGAARRTSFEEVLSEALRLNRDLKRAGLDLGRAKEQEQVARARWDTQLSASIKYQRSTSEPVEGVNMQALRSSALDLLIGASQKLPTGGSVSLAYSLARSTSLMRFSFSGTPFENYAVSYDAGLTLSVSHPLLRGLGLDANLAALRQARRAKEAAAWSARARAEAMVRDLWKAYLDLVEAEGAVRVKGEALLQAERDLARAEALERAGRLPPAELVDYRFAVAQQRRALLEGRTAWLQQSLALRLATGAKLTPGHGLLSAKLPPDPFAQAVPSAQTVAQAAAEHSRELLAALEELKIRKIGLQAVSRDHWPSLEASAAVGPLGRSSTLGRAHETMIRFRGIGWSVGLAFSYLVGHREARAAQEQARLEIERQELTVDELRQTLVSSATRAVALLGMEKEIARTSEKERALAVERLENERKRFAVGRSSLFVLLQLQNDVTAAAQKVLAARLACLKRWAELEALTGALLGRFGISGKGLGSQGGSR
jgi:outer membrane protein TolC